MKHLRNHFALPIYEQRNLMHNAYHFGWISYFNSEIQRNASVVQFFSLQIALHFKVYPYMRLSLGAIHCQFLIIVFFFGACSCASWWLLENTYFFVWFGQRVDA